MKVVLLATDLEARSKPALRMATQLAKSLGARLVVVHVVELPATLKRWSTAAARTDAAVYSRLLKGQTDAARATLEELVREAGSEPEDVRCIAKAGWVAETISEVANKVNADLIVVGRGRGGKLGRNSERIVRMEGRAVLVAPVKAPSELWAPIPGRASRPQLRSSHRARTGAKPAGGRVAK